VIRVRFIRDRFAVLAVCPFAEARAERPAVLRFSGSKLTKLLRFVPRAPLDRGETV
jgi:hypothetical protein